MWLPEKRLTNTIPGVTYDVQRSDTLASFGYPWPVTQPDVTYQSHREALNTERGSARERAWRNCSHYKRQVLVVPAHMTESTNSGTPSWSWERTPYLPLASSWGGPTDALYPGGQFGSLGFPNKGLRTLFVNPEEDGGTERYIPLPSGLDSLIPASLASMLPGIRPKMSLVNSIIELKDFKTLPRTLSNVKSQLNELGDMLRRLSGGAVDRQFKRRLLGRKTLRALIRSVVTKPVSDMYLQYMFNVSPLCSDLSNIYHSVSAVRAKINWLLANEGKLMVSHYRAPLTTYENSDEVFDLSNSQIGTWYNGGKFFRRQVSYGTAMFYASLQYRYTIPDWQKQNMFLNGIMDQLGVTLNPAIIWNAIPWSFVIDWVAGIGRWLDQWKIKNIRPQTELRQYLFSIRVKRTIRCWYETNVGTSHSSGRILTHVVDEDAYHRQLHAPDMYRSIELSGLNLTEFSLGSALLASRY